MDILRRAFTDVKLRFHVARVLSEASTLSKYLSSECLCLAEHHPDIVVAVLRDNLIYAYPDQSCAYLKLLEKLVDSCSSSFHVAMAHDYALHEKLITLAVGRAEDDGQRRARRLARLTLLEYSRMFADDPELEKLSVLAGDVEKRTGRNLMRAIEVENKSVCFIEPRPEDIVMISPIERAENSFSDGAKPLAWACHVCTYINKAFSKKCLACKTPKSVTLNSSPPRGRVVDRSAVHTGETLTGTVCSTGVDGDVRHSAAKNFECGAATVLPANSDSARMDNGVGEPGAALADHVCSTSPSLTLLSDASSTEKTAVQSSVLPLA